MHQLKLLTILLITFALCGAKSSDEPNKPKASEPISLPLTRVIDGDTFIAGNLNVRLWGIDAPEKNEAHFLASKLYLSVLLERAPFSCHFKHKDRYQRYVMICYSMGEDISSLLVQQGLAKDYSRYSGGFYKEDENSAKLNRYGIWK